MFFKSKSKKVKTPIILQMEAVECGATALAIILEYFGHRVPIEKLRIECGVSRDGSRADSIILIAEKYGLNVNAYKTDLKNLLKLELPLIVFWENNHFLVIEGFDKKGVFLNDPLSGHRHVTYKQFKKSYSKIVFTFSPKSTFVKRKKQAGLPTQLFGFIKNSVKPLSYIFSLFLLFGFTAILIPTTIRVFVDFVLIKEQISWIIPIVFFLILICSIQILLIYFQSNSLKNLENKINHVNSSKFIWHLLRLQIQFFFQRSAGEIASRIYLIENFSNLLVNKIIITFFNIIVVCFYFFIMLHYNVFLTLATFTILLLNLSILKIVSLKKNNLSHKINIVNNNLSTASIIGLQAIETIKSTGAEQDFFNKWAGFLGKALNIQNKLEIKNKILSTFPAFIQSISTIIILALGSLFIIDGSLTYGMLIAFLFLTINLLQPIQLFTNFRPTLKQIKTYLMKITDLLNYQEDTIFDAKKAKDLDLSKLSGRLEIKNLSFGYNIVNEPIIKNINLNIANASLTAIVGTSGSGKTTLVKVIAGILKHSDGELLFDDILIQNIPKSIFNYSVALVNQDIFLFEGTIKENITLWDSTITDDLIADSAKDACIHAEIASRKKGYDSHIQENGYNLCYGEKQKIELARALVNNPSILIIDEATSAIDFKTEFNILSNIKRRGITCIIISNRINTIKLCDQIIVLDKGEIDTIGTYDTLLKNEKSLFNKYINRKEVKC
jgi:NHLM bacteriocin system ABC transporter peptidase/ATP-binding protein